MASRPRSLPVHGGPEVAGVVAFLLAGTTALVAGCAAGVPPEEWAKKVCVVVKPWSTSINSALGQAQTQITSKSSPIQTKISLLGFYRGARDSSARALVRVRAAGTPDAENGTEVARQFITSMTDARDAFARAATRTDQLSTSDANTFYAGVVSVGQRLTNENTTNTAGFTKVQSTELQRAFDTVPECR